jgi:flagellar biosynthesis/type III secretory pathway protein FliH
MLHRIASLLGELLRAPDGPRAVTLLLRYLSLVADVGVEQVTQVVQQAVPEAKDLVMTIAEQLRQQGLQQGLQQGIQQGLQQGIQQARLASLCRVLELRFGTIDPELAARLEAVNGEDLERLFDRAVTASSIEEFLGHD